MVLKLKPLVRTVSVTVTRSNVSFTAMRTLFECLIKTSITILWCSNMAAKPILREANRERAQRGEGAPYSQSQLGIGE